MSGRRASGIERPGTRRSLRWVVVPSLLLYGGWKLFLLSQRWTDARLPVAVSIFVAFVLAWAYASLVHRLEELSPNAVLVAGLGSLGPILRIGLEGVAAIRRSLQDHPALTAIDLTLALFLAVVTAPVCFLLYRRRHR